MREGRRGVLQGLCPVLRTLLVNLRLTLLPRLRGPLPGLWWYRCRVGPEKYRCHPEERSCPSLLPSVLGEEISFGHSGGSCPSRRKRSSSSFWGTGLPGLSGKKIFQGEVVFLVFLGAAEELRRGSGRYIWLRPENGLKIPFRIKTEN